MKNVGRWIQRLYALIFFYKYLSDKVEIKANNLLKWETDKKYNELNEQISKDKENIEAIGHDCLSDLWYFLKPWELFGIVVRKWKEWKFILDDLQRILKNIESSTLWTGSQDDFDNLFEDLDLSSTKLWKTADQKNDLVARVLWHLNLIDFAIWDSKNDILWDAYEYLIAQFASLAWKKAGEFYTPQQVSKILAKIVSNGRKKLKNVYDPTCGSGSLLLRVAKEVEQVWEFFWQELNTTTYNLARMNMIMHDVNYRKFNIRQWDTLEDPQHLKLRFDAVVANPPFSAQWKANDLKMSDDRFSMYWKLAPSSKADFAFIEHMIYQLWDNWVCAVVMPHWVLFRWASEWHIRRFLIEEKNYLDAVIWLPANIFYGTSIPTCILVFKKCRENEANILFIDASKGFEKQKNQNTLRDEDVEKIFETYKNRIEIEKYSRVVNLKEIQENDYNLNIPRYIDTFEEEEEINIEEVATKIIELEKESLDIDDKIRWFCAELWIKSPV